MRIGIISDIHANLPALEAVLAHAGRQGVKKYWNLGDFIGYGAFPDEVVTFVRTMEAQSIIGNYDLKVLQFPAKKKKWQESKVPLKYDAFRIAFSLLSAKNRRYLDRLPAEQRLVRKKRTILLTHGSPASNEEPLTDETPKKRLRELSLIADADVICCGHSHVAFQRQVGRTLFINPGSVGRQADGDPRASYAVLSMTKKENSVRLFRVPYDVERAARAVRERGLPEIFAQIALRGLPLEALLPDD